MGRSSAPVSCQVEQCWTIVGQRRGRVWFGRRMRPTTGTTVSVAFDGVWVLQREERLGDVIGFLHTHPAGPLVPSVRDLRTMRAWCGAFGKPLACLIAGPGGVRGFRFDDHSSNGVPLELVQAFPRGVMIGVDADG